MVQISFGLIKNIYHINFSIGITIKAGCVSQISYYYCVPYSFKLFGIQMLDVVAMDQWYMLVCKVISVIFLVHE
jgi:hypothetical protein